MASKCEQNLACYAQLASDASVSPVDPLRAVCLIGDSLEPQEQATGNKSSASDLKPSAPGRLPSLSCTDFDVGAPAFGQVIAIKDFFRFIQWFWHPANARSICRDHLTAAPTDKPAKAICNPSQMGRERCPATVLPRFC